MNALDQTKAITQTFKLLGEPVCSYKTLCETMVVLSGSTVEALNSLIHTGFVMAHGNSKSDDCVWSCSI